MKKIIANAALFILLVTGPLGAATMHTILVGDTFAEDLSNGVVEDLSHMSHFLTRSAYYSGVRYQEVVLWDTQVNPEEIYQYIQDIEVESDDIVVFYFSGHGYRTESKKGNQWPNLYLTSEDVGLDLEEVLTLLREKQPRLIVALADCCNNVIMDRLAPPVVFRQTMSIGQRSSVAQQYKELFVNVKGEVVSVAAEPGCYAVGTDFGGFYTDAFIKHVNAAVNDQSNPISWEIILKRVRKDIASKEYIEGVRQIPIYETRLERN